MARLGLAGGSGYWVRAACGVPMAPLAVYVRGGAER